MSIRDKDWFVVIGIDFGTTYSGFTYAFSDEDKVYDYKEWDDRTTPYAKTKTQLLYIDGKPEYWGHTAVIKGANRRDSQAEFYRILNFKMQLSQQYYQHPGIPEKKFLVTDLVSDYLKFIKDKALEVVRTGTVRNIEDRIIWCLTVPAIWTDEQKSKMRTAAIKAGMISNSDDDYHKLMLVYEPEAAAVYCRQKKSVGVKENDCYMIVDCGGGTVDITTRTLNKKSDLLVLNAIQGVTVNGGPHGSTYVDDKFMTFLSEKITPEALDNFHKKHPVEFLDIRDRWERIKIGLTLDDFKYGTSFEIPSKFRTFLKKMHPNVLKEIEKSEGGDDGSITIKGNELAKFFAESLNGLVCEVEEQFKKLKSANRTCDYIILVGGYSACPLLKETIQEKFSSKVKEIIKDSNPGAAIVEGAAWLGLNPNLNATRTSNLTYGVEGASLFKLGDPESKKIKILGEPDYCDNILLPFVETGDLVEINKAVYHDLSPLSSNQTVLLFKFYSTNKRNVRHINDNDPYTTLQGDKKFEREDTTKGKDWTIRVTMYFGRNEIEILMEDMTTHETQRLEMDFRYKF